MSLVAVPADKRFHRAHVKPRRKRSVLRRVVWPLAKYGALVATAVVAIAVGADSISEARVLSIDRIMVRGNNRMATEDLLSVLAPLRGESIVGTDLDAWRMRLQSLPWIRDAVLRRSLPSTLEVTVSEREPIGIGRGKGRLFLVDEQGRIIDDYGPQYSDVDLPIVDGLALDGGPDDVRGGLAARVIQALRSKPAIARRLSQVVVTDAHNAAVIVDGDPALIYVGEDRFLARLESYLDLAGALRQRVADIDYVDLRFDERIYVRSAATTTRAPTPSRTGELRPAARTSTKSRQN